MINSCCGGYLFYKFSFLTLILTLSIFFIEKIANQELQNIQVKKLFFLKKNEVVIIICNIIIIICYLVYSIKILVWYKIRLTFKKSMKINWLIKHKMIFIICKLNKYAESEPSNFFKENLSYCYININQLSSYQNNFIF
jgi:hypothetical protein